MTNFIWPSDIARAENDELNRVCEYLEEVLNERDALAAHVERLQDFLKAKDHHLPIYAQHTAARLCAELRRQDEEAAKAGRKG